MQSSRRFILILVMVTLFDKVVLSTSSIASSISFSSNFGDNMVLQRATQSNPLTQAAVYGIGATPGETVSVALKANPTPLTTSSSSSPPRRVFANVQNDGSWKALLPSQQAGGDYMVTATSGSDTVTLQNVTFGDVYFCSGQSNMELNMHFTFDRNDTYLAVAQGKYENIRVFHLDHNPVPYGGVNWVINSSVVLANWTVADANIVANGGKGDQCGGEKKKCTTLDQFSAACFYYAQALTDRMVAEAAKTGDEADAVVPLGMIESAYGGTTIEQWLSIPQQLKCSNITCLANKSLPMSAANAQACTQNAQYGNGGLWRGMTAPFVNMTLTGWLWYQGENNLFADAGSTVDGTGYACLLKTMIEAWGSSWSVVPNTTPKNGPFGIVQLADATDEGWGCNIGQMHWAETGNYGVVPNPALPTAFVAAAHDLGEPWDDGCKTSTFCCTCANMTGNPDCKVGPWSTFDPVSKFPWLIEQSKFTCSDTVPSTPQLMGGVHPSTKKHVGERLAQAAWSLHYDHPEVAWTGPVVSSCGIETVDNNRRLRVEFNKTLLGSDTINLKNYSREDKASATFVRVGLPFPDDAWNNYVYKNRAPWWGDDSSWVQVDIVQTSGSGFAADLSKLNGKTITGIKYGQGIPGTIPQSGHKRVCCGSRDITIEPCPPASCPLESVNGKLPAMPFMAAVSTKGGCQGLRPQVITALVAE